MRNAYRDELEAAQARADALDRENQMLRAKLADHEPRVVVSGTVSPITIRVIALFTATLAVMVAPRFPTGGVLLFAAAALLALIAASER